MDDKLGIVVSTKCSTCTAKDRDGNPLRDLIDHKKSTGVATTKIAEALKSDGVFITQPRIDRHFKLHSPWIFTKKKLAKEAKVSNMVEASKAMNRDAEEEIQKLINLGGDRIDAGEITVDKELYMFALNKKTNNDTPVSIQNLVMNFGDALQDKYKNPSQIIEGETLEEKIDEPS